MIMWVRYNNYNNYSQKSNNNDTLDTFDSNVIGYAKSSFEDLLVCAQEFFFQVAKAVWKNLFWAPNKGSALPCFSTKVGGGDLDVM